MIFSVNFLLTTNSYAEETDKTVETPPTSDSQDAGQGIANVLCHVIDITQGATGKTIAILVIISMAIGLFLGKITWGVAIAVAVGIGVLFGANTVVGFVSNTDSKGGSATNICPK